MTRPITKRRQTNQREAFIAAARAAEPDEDEKRWESRLNAVAKPVRKKGWSMQMFSGLSRCAEERSHLHVMPHSLLGVVLFGLVLGCAGTNFSQATVDQLQPGVTTYDQAVAQLGKPYSVAVDASGRRRAIWSYADLGGNRAVGINFAPDGVMERVASRIDSSGTTPGPQGPASPTGTSLGINATTVPNAVATRMKIKGGAMVATVASNSAAARAGMQVGDVIVAYDGRPVSSPREMQAIMRDQPPTGSVVITVQRGGDQLPLTVVF